MKYGYARVSTGDQNPALQLAAQGRAESARSLRDRVHARPPRCSASRGLKTVTPRPAKCLTLRVTTVRPCSRPVAAIMPSGDARRTSDLLTLSVWSAPTLGNRLGYRKDAIAKPCWNEHLYRVLNLRPLRTWRKKYPRDEIRRSAGPAGARMCDLLHAAREEDRCRGVLEIRQMRLGRSGEICARRGSERRDRRKYGIAPAEGFRQGGVSPTITRRAPAPRAAAF